MARQMVDQMLAQHRAAHEGQWPSKVAFTLWAGDFIHTEGTSVAQILYLLGWNRCAMPLAVSPVCA